MSSRQPVKTNPGRTASISLSEMESAFPGSRSPITTKTALGTARHTSRAARNSSRKPLSATSRPTLPTTGASAGIPSSRRKSPRRRGSTRAGSNLARSIPFPRSTLFDRRFITRRLARARSAELWYSSRSENRAATHSRPMNAARFTNRSSGLASNPWTVLITHGTPTALAAILPMTPGFALWVWTRSKRSRRKIPTSSANALTSPAGSHARVALAHGM